MQGARGAGKHRHLCLTRKCRSPFRQRSIDARTNRCSILRWLSTQGNASLNLLWALEGALSGLSWQTVTREHRLSLLLALEALDGDD
jgi:hypothetical protein